VIGTQVLIFSSRQEDSVRSVRRGLYYGHRIIILATSSDG
jgi:hypothetical protein